MYIFLRQKYIFFADFVFLNINFMIHNLCNIDQVNQAVNGKSSQEYHPDASARKK